MESRLNVVHVMADQHHAGLMGCAGHDQVITPNFDAFAAGGMRFTQAYCQNPICTPSRVCTLSGQYCHNHGYYGLSGLSNFALPSWLGHFREHGYRTAAYGKLHLPCTPHNWIADHVDDFGDTYEYARPRDGVSRYIDELKADGLFEKEDSWHNRTGYYSQTTIPLDARPSDLPYERTQERWSVDQTIQFIDQAPDKPFCVHLSFQKPHHPLLPQKRFWEMYDANLDLPTTIDIEPTHRPAHFQKMWRNMREHQWEFSTPGQTWRDGARRAWRGTLACVTQIDDVFGILIRELKQRQLLGNTIIVYHSDHGCYHGMHGIIEKAPGICSQDVCSVPMIWQVPGLTPASRTCDQMVELVDVADTLTSLCGLPAMTTTDGYDLSELLSGANQPVRQMAVTENPWSKSIRFGDWRYIYYPSQMFDGQDVGELYHIANDPDETMNLYADPEYQSVVREAKDRLLEWVITTSRVRSVWPRLGKTPEGQSVYESSTDGLENKYAGPKQRLLAGHYNYV